MNHGSIRCHWGRASRVLNKQEVSAQLLALGANGLG